MSTSYFRADESILSLIVAYLVKSSDSRTILLLDTSRSLIDLGFTTPNSPSTPSSHCSLYKVIVVIFRSCLKMLSRLSTWFALTGEAGRGTLLTTFLMDGLFRVCHLTTRNRTIINRCYYFLINLHL